MKICPRCIDEKDETGFSKDSSTSDGLRYYCNACLKSLKKTWQKPKPRNKEVQTAYHLRNRDRLLQRAREQQAEYRKVNYAACLAARKEHHLRNTNRANMWNVECKLRKRGRPLPPWANVAAIEAVYRMAHAITKATGVRHAVDHIYPLKGERVSGLHVENNLQILTRVENGRKGNKVPERVFDAPAEDDDGLDF